MGAFLSCTLLVSEFVTEGFYSTCLQDNVIHGILLGCILLCIVLMVAWKGILQYSTPPGSMPPILTTLSTFGIFFITLDLLVNLLLFLDQVPSVRVHDSPHFVLFSCIGMYAFIYTNRIHEYFVEQSAPSPLARSLFRIRGYQPVLKNEHPERTITTSFRILLWIFICLGLFLSISETLQEGHMGQFLVPVTNITTQVLPLVSSCRNETTMDETVLLLRVHLYWTVTQVNDLCIYVVAFFMTLQVTMDVIEELSNIQQDKEN
jgi:hypothetical protein